MRAVARRTRRKFYYSLHLLLVPTMVREIIILFGIYVLIFQYELLVHNPNTDVYRRILECRFTYFAPYVVNIETDIIVRTLPRPSTLAHVVDVQQFIRSHIARTIYTAVPLLLDLLKRRHVSPGCGPPHGRRRRRHLEGGNRCRGYTEGTLLPVFSMG